MLSDALATESLDRMIAQASATEDKRQPFKGATEPPVIFSSQSSAILVLTDGPPILAPLGDTGIRYVEAVAKPHRHFVNVIMTQATWKKATNMLI